MPLFAAPIWDLDRHLVKVGLPWWSDNKESACNSGDPGLIPGLERVPGELNGYRL